MKEVKKKEGTEEKKGSKKKHRNMVIEGNIWILIYCGSSSHFTTKLQLYIHIVIFFNCSFLLNILVTIQLFVSHKILNSSYNQERQFRKCKIFCLAFQYSIHFSSLINNFFLFLSFFSIPNYHLQPMK